MKTTCIRQNGLCSLISLFFLFLFSVIALAFTATSQMNLQVAGSFEEIAQSQTASESGLAFADHLVKGYSPPTGAYTLTNTVSQTEAEQTVAWFAQYVQTALNGSAVLDGQTVSYDSAALTVRVPGDGAIPLGAGQTGAFALSFEYVPGDGTTVYHELRVTSVGTAGEAVRSVRLSYPIKKDTSVLEFAMASRGRIWLTGDTTIDGDVYSDWDNIARSPFNMTSDTTVLGTINTTFTKAEVESAAWQMETLDADGNPMLDADGNRVVSAADEVQGDHRGINYGATSAVPGLAIGDYNTDAYKTGLANLPACPSAQRVVEYFPHASGSYGVAANSSSLKVTRHVYQNQTITNMRVPYNYNALFNNCTFEGVLYVDCYKSGTSYYNNVRFNNCTFHGPIITNTPQVLKWQQNALYFTGSATFQNTALAEATILAPHFNVDLGNTNPSAGTENELTGAIVGGIVDIRGNARIYGTIVSMADTSAWTSGYVTNVGATLGDGGSETTQIGDVGTILIRPDKENLLPSGIKTPIVLKRDGGSFAQL